MRASAAIAGQNSRNSRGTPATSSRTQTETKTITLGGKEYAPADRWEDSISRGIKAGLEQRRKQHEAAEKGKKTE